MVMKAICFKGMHIFFQAQFHFDWELKFGSSFKVISATDRNKLFKNKNKISFELNVICNSVVNI